MRLVEPLARLYQYVVPLGFVVQQSFEWRRNRRQARRVLRACEVPKDIVDISAEAILRFAALTFDPRHLALGRAEALAQLLLNHGAIDHHTGKALRCAMTYARKATGSSDAANPHDLIAVLEQLQGDPCFGRHGRKNDIAIALGILRTIEVCRRSQSPPY